MAAILHCPNTACGRISHLGDDPLGRIFRCPRCHTRLPAASATATDPRWTAVGSLQRFGDRKRSFQSTHAHRWVGSTLSPAINAAWNNPVRERSATIRGTGNVNHLSGWSATSGGDLVLGPDDSGEIVIAPVLANCHPDSTWTTTSASSVIAMVTDQQISDLLAANSLPGSEEMVGRFRIVGLVGEGEHAVVYRAYDPILDRDIALKVPRHAVLKSTKMLDRFLGEAKSLARLRHPRIVPVYEAGCAGERYFIAMALIEGHSLAEWLLEGTVTIHQAALIVAELAEALAYAHSQRVIHRDVKPANVRLDDHGSAYLMDFGIAYRPDSGEIPLPPGVILGTPAYLAPEQAQGGQNVVLPASDQYSLGVVFYELLCGRPPFCGPPSYVMFHTIHHAPPSPRTFAPHVPRSLASICLKALAKCPDGRYRNCQQFADDLWHWLSSETPSVHRRSWTRSKG